MINNKIIEPDDMVISNTYYYLEINIPKVFKSISIFETIHDREQHFDELLLTLQQEYSTINLERKYVETFTCRFRIMRQDKSVTTRTNKGNYNVKQITEK